MKTSLAIATAFERAAGEDRAAFIPYLTAGFPDSGTFLDIIQALADNGADLIEIGLPFSDTLSAGPVIQKAGQSALESGVTPSMALDLEAQARRRVSVPLVVMTYYIPYCRWDWTLLRNGRRDAGLDGTIVPDLSLEEAAVDGRRGAERTGQHQHAGLRPPPRTAVRASFGRPGICLLRIPDRDRARPGRYRKAHPRDRGAQGRKPGSGGGGLRVSGPRQAAPLAQAADGVIVGTALIREIMKHDRADARWRPPPDWPPHPGRGGPPDRRNGHEGGVMILLLTINDSFTYNAPIPRPTGLEVRVVRTTGSPPPR
jgi:tryptophan synthase alpha chain